MADFWLSNCTLTEWAGDEKEGGREGGRAGKKKESQMKKMTREKTTGRKKVGKIRSRDGGWRREQKGETMQRRGRNATRERPSSSPPPSFCTPPPIAHSSR